MRAEGDPLANPDPDFDAATASPAQTPEPFNLLGFLALPASIALLIALGFYLFFRPAPPSSEAEYVPPAPDRIKRALRELAEFGTAALRERDFDRALKYFRQMAEIDPDSPTAWNNIGLTLVGQKRYAAALEPLSKAISLAPAAASIPLVSRSFCLRNLDRLPEAKADLKTALDLNPGDPVASNLLLLARIQSGEHDAVAREIRTSQQSAIPAMIPLTVGAVIGLAVSDGDLQGARSAVEQARKILSPYALTMILNDPLIAQQKDTITGLSLPLSKAARSSPTPAQAVP